MKMPIILFFVLFFAVTAIIVAAKSIAITREGERLVVVRPGKLLYVYPPGLNFIIPFHDKGVRVRVDQIPGWQSLPDSELEQRLVQVVMERSG